MKKKVDVTYFKRINKCQCIIVSVLYSLQHRCFKGSLNLYRAPRKIKNDLKWPQKITFVCRSYWSHTVIVLTDCSV